MLNNQARISTVESKLKKTSTLFKNIGSAMPMPVTASVEYRNRVVVQSPGQVGTQQDIINRAALDTKKLNNFLKNTTAGRLFTKKQIDLQYQNPRMEVANQINLNGGFYSNGNLGYTRIYNDRNLLLQVNKSGQGLRFDRPGQLPVTPFQDTYFYTVKAKTASQNRLVTLSEIKIQNTRRFATPTNEETRRAVSDLGLSRKSFMLFEYMGGPNANDQQGFTGLRRFDYTTDWAGFTAANKVGRNYRPEKGSVLLSIANKALAESSISEDGISTVTVSRRRDVPGTQLNTPFTPTSYDSQASHSLGHSLYTTSSFPSNLGASPINKASAFSYSQLLSRRAELNYNVKVDTDFRNTIGQETYTEGYEGAAGEGYRDKVYSLGNPGVRTINRKDYSTVGYGTNNQGVDKINMLDIDENYKDGQRDLIKCVFTAMETQQDKNNLSNVSVPIVFRSYVTNFADNYNASYNEHQYVGRGEKFYTYNVSDRKINFNLKVAASSRAEMKPLYRKLNYLASQLYPGYSGFGGGTGNGFMRAPLIKVTVGDYLSDQPGFMTSLNITVPDEANWEIAADKNGKDKDMYELPQILELAVQFTPIHNFLARRSAKYQDGIQITPFITPNEINNKFNIG